MSSNINEKKWSDITKIIKVLSSSLRDYIVNIEDMEDRPDEDTSLMAMQVLSILCGLDANFGKDKINKIWSLSLDVAQNIHESKTDRVVSKLQTPPGFENWDKN